MFCINVFEIQLHGIGDSCYTYPFNNKEHNSGFLCI